MQGTCEGGAALVTRCCEVGIRLRWKPLAMFEQTDRSELISKTVVSAENNTAGILLVYICKVVNCMN